MLCRVEKNKCGSGKEVVAKIQVRDADGIG